MSLCLSLSLCVVDSFVLNTTVSAPHDAQITDVQFCPAAADSQTAVLVSTSEEGHFKAWQLDPPAQDQGEPSHSTPPSVSWLEERLRVTVECCVSFKRTPQPGCRLKVLATPFCCPTPNTWTKNE